MNSPQKPERWFTQLQIGTNEISNFKQAHRDPLPSAIQRPLAQTTFMANRRPRHNLYFWD
jgi:hypothetical protein